MRVNLTKDRVDWIVYRELPAGVEVERPTPIGRYPSYPVARRAIDAEGWTFDNAGWRLRLLMWHWHSHSFDRYPEWEIEDREQGTPAFAKLTHVRGKGAVESHELAARWDDVAEAGFYQRDWTDDGIPFVGEGGTYRSGWWFATLAERDRFIGWYDDRRKEVRG